MERTDLFEQMGELKPAGMRLAYEEVKTTGIKRQHEHPQIVGDLLNAEIAEKRARSIKCQLTIAKLPHPLQHAMATLGTGYRPSAPVTIAPT